MKTIPLTKGQEALVDDEDYDRINAHKWHARWNICNRSYYAARTSKRSDGGKRREVRMHQDVIGENKGGNIDHINHDTLDNRRENLRPCTVSQNGANQGVRVNNTSGFKGVSLFKRDQVWQAYINMFGKRRHLGYYATPIEAALAYDRAALEYHGEFAMTNKAMGLLP